MKESPAVWLRREQTSQRFAITLAHALEADKQAAITADRMLNLEWAARIIQTIP